MKLLVVNADDYGLTPSVSTGILKAHKNGIVTSTSVIANGIDIERSLKWLKNFPNLGVGVHLTLVDQLRSVTPEHKVNSLLVNSKFRKNWRHFAMDWFLKKISRIQIELEFSSQIQYLLDRGFQIYHLDSHQYLHLLPGMPDIILSLVCKFKIPFIRVPKRHIRGPIAVYMNHLGNRYHHYHQNIQVSESLGFEDTGKMKKEKIIYLLKKLSDSPNDLVDLTVHPSLLKGRNSHLFKWNRNRQEELDSLCAKDVLTDVEKMFTLTNYKSLSVSKYLPEM